MTLALSGRDKKATERCIGNSFVTLVGWEVLTCQTCPSFVVKSTLLVHEVLGGRLYDYRRRVLDLLLVVEIGHKSSPGNQSSLWLVDYSLHDTQTELLSTVVRVSLFCGKGGSSLHTGS